jgi:hypothetical protein
MSLPHGCDNGVMPLFYLRLPYQGLEVGDFPEKTENLYQRPPRQLKVRAARWNNW